MDSHFLERCHGMPNYRLITFDAYSGLADFKATLMPVIIRILELPTDAAEPFLTTWRAKQLSAAALSNALNRGRMSFHDCTGLALDYAASRHGVTVSASQRGELIESWYPLQPWPEADDVLGALKARGYAVAILSNGDRAMLESVANQVAVDIDHIFSTESAGVYKPDPRVYDLPIDELGLGRNEYLHVAGGANDVVGAKSAGVACYWNNRTGDQVLYPQFTADFEGPNLTGLLDIL